MPQIDNIRGVVILNSANLRFRMLSYLDFQEFKRAINSSTETNEPYLSYGTVFQHMPVLGYVSFYMDMMKDQKVDHFGLFDGSTLLAHAQYQHGLGPQGTELIGWTRKEFQNQKVGELGLITATNYGLNQKSFSYVELRIDAANVASRRVAEKAGYKPYLKFRPFTGIDVDFVLYFKFHPRIEELGRRYGLRPIDIFNNPATNPPYQHYLRSPSVVYFYEWPFPDYSEDAKPVNFKMLDGYVGLINFHPDDIPKFETNV